MRLAICDDESNQLAAMRKSISASKSLASGSVVEVFSDGASLVGRHKMFPFDIIFLDIQMEGMNGLQAGAKIRESDESVIIILVTSFQEYVLQSFRIEAFDYVMKPITNEAVKNVLGRALRKYKERHYLLAFKNEDGIYTLDANDIVHIERYHGEVTVATKEKEYKYKGSIAEYAKQLELFGFFRCSLSLLINLNYVKSIENKCIITKYNHKLHCPERNLYKFKQAFNSFITKYRGIIREP